MVYSANLIEAIRFFDPNQRLLLFPDWETLPYDHFSPHQDIISERLSTLYQIPTLSSGVIITTVSTLMHQLPPRHYLDANTFMLKLGDSLNIDSLRIRLTQAGYRLVTQVREHGEFSIKGSLIDLFPMGSHIPFRIDLFDNEVDSIRSFSAETQRSIEKISEIRLLPAKEFPLNDETISYFRQAWRNQFKGNPLNSPLYQDISEGIAPPGIEYYIPFFFEKMATFFDYLPPQTQVIIIEDIPAKANEFWQEVETRYKRGHLDTTYPLLTPSQLFMLPNKLHEVLRTYTTICIHSSVNHTFPIIKTFDFATKPAPELNIVQHTNQPLSALQTFLSTDTGRMLICAETAGRREIILQLLNSIGFHPKHFASWAAFFQSSDRYGIVVAPLETGFMSVEPPLTLVTETQLYGKRVMQRRLRKKSIQDPNALIRDLNELRIGDAVVHIDRGIGRYMGLQTLKVGDQLGDFLSLSYQDNDKLYVPISSLHLISRYTTADPEHVSLDKLGTNHWQRAKRKAAEKIRDVAAELLDLYANRAAQSGHACQAFPEQEAKFAEFPLIKIPEKTIKGETTDMKDLSE